MKQSYKIFFNERVLHIYHPEQTAVEPAPNSALKYANRAELQEQILKFAASNSMVQAVVYSDHPSATLEEIKAMFHYIEAAGGVVEGPGGFLLCIHRLGVWDLPKGKAEAGELPSETALREVEEECGIGNIALRDKITDTYHTYEHKGKMVLKRTHWYAMAVDALQPLTPQLSEDILAAEWLGRDRLGEVLQNTYPSIVEVLEKGGYVE
ncbi:MAG: NUDIX domain-containing protein [Marinilabiliaceae bacterium]|nr:NUDIX domain-containing protein [Marinilabiliaceae bacterium]